MSTVTTFIRKLSLILLLQLPAFFALAQDSVIFNNGVRAYVKVTELGPATIKYAENGPDGIELKEKKRSEISYIVFSNGMKETMGKGTPVPAIAPSPPRPEEMVEVKRPSRKPAEEYGKNIVGFNVFEFFFT